MPVNSDLKKEANKDVPITNKAAKSTSKEDKTKTPTKTTKSKTSTKAKAEVKKAIQEEIKIEDMDKSMEQMDTSTKEEKQEPKQDSVTSPLVKSPRRSHVSGTKKENNSEESSKKNTENKKDALLPSETADTLKKLTHEELINKADELKIKNDEVDGLKKDELIQLIAKVVAESEGFKKVKGILEIKERFQFLRCRDYMKSDDDVFVQIPVIRKNGLRRGDEIVGETIPSKNKDDNPVLANILEVNGIPFKDFKRRPHFRDLTPVFPDSRLTMEHDPNAITSRIIDLVAPIGKGQRGLIVSPPKAGKTTILKDIAASITKNNPEVHLMCLLIDERPEEVTDMQRSIHGEVISSTFDMPCENHITIAELTIERAKRLVESGRDVVILLDSITRLARAYNLAQPASGRVLSGGVDSSALYPPKKFLGAARNIENGGSLTILASALIDTGSKMDEVIFEEFKGTGNMELRLDRNLADRRIYPAIDPISSGTRKEDLLLDPQEAPLI
jgi:transcription termination factor Rho